MNENLPEYFQHCNSPDEIKSYYRELAMAHHPDRLGLNATAEQQETAKRTMQEINRQYSIAMARAIRGEKPNATDEQVSDLEDVAEAIRQAIEAIIHLPNISIEIRGSWVWVFGDTKAVKETLKAAGYKWLPGKEGQPWAYMAVRSNGRGDWSHDEIVERYGRQTVTPRSKDKLAA